MLDISKKIKDLRIFFKKSQTEFGEILGLSYKQIQRYEYGNSITDILKIKQLAEYFNIPIQYFFEEMTVNEAVLNNTINIQKMKKGNEFFLKSSQNTNKNYDKYLQIPVFSLKVSEEIFFSIDSNTVVDNCLLQIDASKREKQLNFVAIKMFSNYLNPYLLLNDIIVIKIDVSLPEKNQTNNLYLIKDEKQKDKYVFGKCSWDCNKAKLIVTFPNTTKSPIVYSKDIFSGCDNPLVGYVYGIFRTF